MKPLTINRSDLEMAFEMSADFEAENYLDTQTGEIVSLYADITAAFGKFDRENITRDEQLTLIQQSDAIPDWIQDSLIHMARIRDDFEKRYLEIPPQRSRDGYEEMQAFIATLEDEHLRELLEVAIHGSGAFRRFRDVLHRYPDAQDAWYDFKNKSVESRMNEWLNEEGITAQFV